jgi:FkbH-like protein
MEQDIAQLSLAQKRILLARLMQNVAPPQLSITQERMWQLQQLQPESGTYNFQIALAIDGPLQQDVLVSAMQQIPIRHETLRTSYGTEKGQPKISIVPKATVSITTESIIEVPQSQQDAAIQEIVRRDAGRAFNLSEPPLFRATLICLGSERFVLLLTMHHIISDVLSLELFLRDSAEYYSAAMERRAPSLPPLLANYQDFARLQRELDKQEAQKVDLEYWRQTLASPTPTEWFSDYPRPLRATGRAATEFLTIPDETVTAVEAFARSMQVTPYTVFLAALYVVLGVYQGQTDLSIGTATAGRIRSDFEALIGMFSYPLVMRINISAEKTLSDLIREVQRVLHGATEHAGAPFSKVAEAVHRATPLTAPLVRVMFSYVSRLQEIQFSGLTCKRLPTDRGVTDLDLFLTLYREGKQWHGICEYSTDLFTAETIREFLAGYLAVLNAAIKQPASLLSTLSSLAPRRKTAQISIAATFTADSLEEIIQFWSRELRLPLRSDFAPYNQVFQQFLDFGSPLYSADTTLNVLLIRPEDWVRYLELGGDEWREAIQRNVNDFVSCVGEAADRMRAHCSIYLCPASDHVPAEVASAIAAAETAIIDGLSGVKGIEVISPRTWLETYPVEDLHSPQMDRIGHVPYTNDFFVAVGTAVTRKLSSLVRKPYKVIAVDCDNTLWRGVCAEDGAIGVHIEEPHRALQEFLIEQATSGVLVCLCSKNEESDALAVFRENPAMLLKLEHIAAYRINWENKSSNLRSLAAELQLGLDSFIFLDDNPLECAEVSGVCPEVAVLSLPEDLTSLRGFLQHAWVFDRQTTTEEDRQRLTSYRANQQRQELRTQTSSLKSFLQGLELVVNIAPSTTSQLERLSQLSQRTNQFNSSANRYSEPALRRLLSDGSVALAVHVKDRFGDYGLVGSVLYHEMKQSLYVTSFLLSCRVLGRGVEHRIVQELGQIAQRQGLSRIVIAFEKTPRNEPFQRFIATLPVTWNEPGNTYELDAAAALNVTFDMESHAMDVVSEGGNVTFRSSPSQSLAALARIPHELASVPQIRAQLQSMPGAARHRSSMAFVEPQTEMEHVIASVWSSILRLDRVGRDDNFFEAGGTSLLLVQVNSDLTERLGIDIAITDLFQYPTVRSLATHLGGKAPAGASLKEAHSRGSTARERMLNRKKQLAGSNAR